MQRTSSSYVCLNCLRRGAQQQQSARARIANARLCNGQVSEVVHQRRTLATVQDPDRYRSSPLIAGQLSSSPSAKATSYSSKGPPRPIRERLREWEEKNPAPIVVSPRDYAALDATRNSMTRGESPFMVEVDEGLSKGDEPMMYDGEVIDVRPDAAAVQAGDMVEVSSDSWRVRLLAVCLGRFNGYYHFYTNTGKWFTSNGMRTMFKLNGFAGMEELKPVIEALPPVDSAIAVLNVLQDLKQGPSRDAGADLIRKMQTFATNTDLIHQANAPKLDNAFRVLAGDEKYMTLHEITEALLPSYFKRDGEFQPAALYAVHKVLLADDVGFRPVTQLGYDRPYLFEISSARDVELVALVENMVRRYYDDPDRIVGLSDALLQPKPGLGIFLSKARQLIGASRKARQWSAHGTLSPYSQAPAPKVMKWHEVDLAIISFMHLWASFGKFSRTSRLHHVGSSILRALGRYDESEYLVASTGWTFLQEIGWIMPWDLQARYGTRLPGVPVSRSGGLVRDLPAATDGLLGEDVFTGSRKVWDDVTAYCIDAASTTDIDDAVSVQPTSTPGEYWIHVHVADPGSCVRPDSPLARQASLVPQTAYLPGHFERMFQEDVIRERFSLAPDRPCLTFSAKVNEDGTVLESDITPGTLKKVIYICPKEVSAICGEAPSAVDVRQQAFQVGIPDSEEKPPNRNMSSADDISQQDITNLQTLSKLAKALTTVRLSKGSMPLYWPRPSAQVSFANTKVTEHANGFFHCTGDPSIRVSYDNSFSNPLVESTMRLAGEVAAQWCRARNIPIPYRTQPQAAHNLAQIRALANDVLYPQLRAGRRPRDADAQAFRALLGADELSSSPGLHFTMGADAYAKATSPLRRYADLLLHWQVEAALLAERGAGGESLVGRPAREVEALLPFSKQRLEDDVLPMLRVRERAMRALDNVDGTNEWILQALVRAWKFPSSSSSSSSSPSTSTADAATSELPRDFRFEVQSVLTKRAARGRLDWFDRQAVLEPGMLAGCAGGVTMADVRAGDVFRVELADVNVHSKQISVRALERVSLAEDAAVAAA